MPRQRHVKPDANQAGIVKQLRDLRFVVIVVHTLGGDALDLFVLGMSLRHDGMYLWSQWEIKTEDGELTSDESDYIGGWHYYLGDDAPINVARSVDDILRWYGRVM